ncbi:cold shock domain-containing protein [Catenulispora yoronensis]|uniref:Cold shock domain-containing protein n=1 Tax=Catenulispora yoronensis TaxID=450799 RepID=A0ABP5GDC3_9ACTN
MAVRGTVVSFDRIKGYGFVAAETGGEDVFLHVNDLLDDKNLLGPGSIVDFEIEDGDRGPKASQVSVVKSSQRSDLGSSRQRTVDADNDDMCDVLSVAEFEKEITEILLHADPTLNAAQILAVRNRVKQAAQNHGWVDR